MKNNKIFLFLSVLLVVSVVINSCQKQTQLSSIQSLFTGGTWELASVERRDYLGGSLLLDSIYGSCDVKQFLTFSGNTCTYTNYHCITQSKSGSWLLAGNGLYLQSNIALTDTLPGDSCCHVTHPFANAEVYNVGQYSLVLYTGDIGSYFTSTQYHTIYIYGFVRESSTSN